MDTSAALIHVQTMLQVLKSPIYSEIESLLDDESELVTLKKKTMPMVEVVLQKAEKQEMLQPDDCRMLQISLEGLPEAVFEADNLLDEITTLVQSKKLMDGNTEVSLFLPRFNLAYHAFITSCQKIGRILDEIKSDHPKLLSMKMGKTEVRNEDPRETHSFVSEKEDVIIGRENDKRIVLGMLLDSSVQEAVSVISIVGIGGLGKTALAQLVYNDVLSIVEVKPFELRMWVCISQDFNVKVLLRQLLVAATKEAVDSSLRLEELQTRLREKLDGKKFLLVLDDVWNEESDNWKKLEIFLKQGARDSRVIVTTRSKKVASVVGSHHTHVLEGLSDEDSWNLFQRMAGQVQLEAPFIEIGKEIVRKCASVPLAIRVAGSFLKGNPEEIWWEYLANMKNMHLLANMKDGEKDILNVLKISYHYLPTHLKCCFTYCAVYPKDYRIEKEQLIQLWMAQGYILPSNGQSFEVWGERYFTVLLQRCFFQDVQKDDEDEIISCKMHHLIHDLAEEVAGSAISSSHDHRNSLGDKTLHLSILMEDDHYSDKKPPPNMKSLRTITLSTNPPSYTEDDNIDKFTDWLDMKYLRRLRVLDLKFCFHSKLSSMTGELLHLRYLDLSGNEELEHLPNSITQLYNLQTLKLEECWSLEELPRNLNKLVNLRHLDVRRCHRLTHMPPGMNTMTSLHKLTRFVVCCMPAVDNFGGLGDIQCLNHLRDSIKIQIKSGLTSYDATKVREGRYLINKPHLRYVKISWNEECEEGNNAEAWLQGLQPHSNLGKFRLKNYPGTSFPNWVESSMNLNNCLPHLVKLELFECRSLDHLPLVSQLLHLKVLKIRNLRKLEYMESNTSSSSSSSSSRSERAIAQSGGSSQEDELVFFPSLEELELVGMPELKGWWKTPPHLVLFLRLSVLQINACPNLTSFPFCSKMKKLMLLKFNRKIGEEALNNRISQSQGLWREVVIDDVGFLNCLPTKAFQHLSILNIKENSKIERLTTGEVGQLFQSGCLSSLRELEFDKCSKLKSISGRGVWKQFTALESLKLENLEEMEMEKEEEDVPWKCLAHTLRTLRMHRLPKVVRLPIGMQHLTALQSLVIQDCHNLEEIPAWIGSLSSLQQLSIFWCSKINKKLRSDARIPTHPSCRFSVI